MNVRKLMVALVLAVSALSAQRVDAQPSLKDDVGALAWPIVAAGEAAGISIGVVDRAGREHYFNYGTIGPGGRSPDRNTLFEIGSITKCFTGIVLADMVGHGEVHLNDPAAQFVPAGVRLPRVSNRSITLEDLATYSAGLPRMPGNIHGDLPHYSRKQLFEFLAELARKEGPRSPERHYFYSNLGFSLLGQCLADRAGEQARELIVRRVCRPLGMRSTVFTPEGPLVGRVAVVHDKAGRPTAPWQTGVIAPAGMLRSTTSDMVRFIRANVGLDETPIAPALRLAQVPRYETGAEGKKNQQIGLGWFINPQTGFVSHNGGTAGSSSNVVFHPREKIGVVVLINQSKAPATKLSLQIMQRLRGGAELHSLPEHPPDDGTE